jgi:RimJ/RimL family protein N-acetyltransferase
MVMADYFWERGDIRLRPLGDEDVDAYLSADLDSEAKRVLNHCVGLPRSRASQAESLPVDFKNAPQRLDFAIETLKGEFVGFAAIDRIEEQSGNFSTVTFILEPYRRKHYAEDAKVLMLRYMFDERRFEKYNTDCVETNEAIIGHLRKLGCVEEGRRRRRIFTNGRYFDEILFGLTKEEWKGGGT